MPQHDDTTLLSLPPPVDLDVTSDQQTGEMVSKYIFPSKCPLSPNLIPTVVKYKCMMHHRNKCEVVNSSSILRRDEDGRQSEILVVDWPC